MKKREIQIHNLKPKRKIFLLGLLFFCSQYLSAQTSNDWENPSVFAKNQTEGHVSVIPYSDEQSALSGNRKKSPFYLSLNGYWKFSWSINPEGAPGDFHQTDYPADNWDALPIPSNWQMHGYGRVHYRNVGHAFPSNPPHISDDYNPVGSYKRTFQIPQTWENKEVFLHFAGVKSAFYVWINGKMVGYNQGSMTPAEFNVTPYLKKGKNQIAVQVYRFSDGTYLECQDMVRLSGIYHRVYLYSKPRIHLKDLYVHTDLDKAYQDATLLIDAKIQNSTSRSRKAYSLKASLYDGAGKKVFMDKTLDSGIIMDAGTFKGISFHTKVKDPEKWSAEFPNLYTLIVKLLDQEGTVIEVISEKVGFREVEIKDKAILINGVPVKFNGVNWIPHHPTHGKAVSEKMILQDLKTMKRNNINCIRTSHYPPDPVLLDLADKYGLYIVDEANIEAHDNLHLSGDMAWREAFLDRATHMVERDKNHPSVVIWSTGNEAGKGDNLAEAVKAGKAIDPSRPGWLYGGNSGRYPFEDIVGPRYPPVGRLTRIANTSEKFTRPSFMDEYAHAYGNGMGNHREISELIRSTRRLTGGALWDWKNQGLEHPRQTIPDQSGNGNDGVLMGGATLSQRKSGKALVLSGNDDWVELYEDPSLDISGPSLTLTAWIYPRPWQGKSPVIAKGRDQYALIQPARETMEFSIVDEQKITVKTQIPKDWYQNWHHVSGVFDGTKLAIYIDGKLQNTQKHTGTIRDGSAPVTIGRAWGTEWFSNAMIDEVRIYKNALTAREIKREMNTKPQDAKVWLSFDEIENRGTYLGYGIYSLPNSTDGIVYTNGTPQTELTHVGKNLQPIQVEKVDLKTGTIAINNESHFRNLNQYNTTWEILEDGHVIQTGNTNLHTPAQRTDTVSLDYKKPDIKAGSEYWLNISFRLKGEYGLLPDNHELAWEQLKLPFYKENTPKINRETLPEIGLKETDHSAMFSNSIFHCTISKKSGKITSYRYEDKEFLEKSVGFTAWRAPILNEQRHIAREWREVGLDDLVNRVESFKVVKEKPYKYKVNINSKVKGTEAESGFAINSRLTILRNGEITISQQVDPIGELPERLPKIGLQAGFKKEFRQLTWFGRGPMETYPGRKMGARVGIYSKTAGELYEPYIVPGDYGNRSDVRWASLTNNQGTGWLVSGDELLNISVHPFTTDNLDRARYTYQLQQADVVFFNIDHVVSGVGTKFHQPSEKYQVKTKPYSYTVKLKPISSVPE